MSEPSWIRTLQDLFHIHILRCGQSTCLQGRCKPIAHVRHLQRMPCHLDDQAGCVSLSRRWRDALKRSDPLAVRVTSKHQIEQLAACSTFAISELEVVGQARGVHT